jgi:hypothetical protein
MKVGQAGSLRGGWPIGQNAAAYHTNLLLNRLGGANLLHSRGWTEDTELVLDTLTQTGV